MPKGLGLAAQGITSGPVWDRVVKGLLSLDGAEHHRLRRLVSKAFTPKAAARLRTTCVDVINELVDQHTSAGHCDMVADIARQYPIPIICALLGVPRQHWQLFSDWADDIFKIFTWNVANDAPDILRAWEHLDAYIDGMVTRRREALTDDLLSDLIRAEVDGDRLTHDELLMLAGGILMAGTDTTRNQLAAAVQVLCDHPDQWALLAEHPELAPNAVEELMRYSPIIFSTMRVAVEDVELAGFTIPAGTLVIAEHGRRQPRPRRIRRARPPRYHPRRPAGHADLRRRHPLLPRHAPGENRTRRGAHRHHAPDAQSAPRRCRPVAADDGNHRARHPAHRVRRRALTADHQWLLSRARYDRPSGS